MEFVVPHSPHYKDYQVKDYFEDNVMRQGEVVGERS
jgi:hypothetical protein